MIKKKEAVSITIGFIFIGLILFFNWKTISLLLLVALVFFIIAGGILYLVSIVSEPGSSEDPTTYKKFIKALIIFSIPLSAGLFWEWSENSIPSTFSYIAFFVWGNTAIATFAILINKFFTKRLNKKNNELIK